MLAVKVYGPDVASLKGKITRAKPLPVRHNTVASPPELVETHRKIELCINGLCVCGMPFLSTIDTTIRYRTAQWVPSRKLTSYTEVLANVMTRYEED